MKATAGTITADAKKSSEAVLGVYIVVFELRGRTIAAEVAAHDEPMVHELIKKDRESANATNIRIISKRKTPKVLRWLTALPTEQWVNGRE